MSLNRLAPAPEDDLDDISERIAARNAAPPVAPEPEPAPAAPSCEIPNSIRAVMVAVSEASGVPLHRLSRQGRAKECERAARSIVVLIAREYGYSFPEIARRMRRDHTTIIHSYRRAEALLAAKNFDFIAMVRRVDALLARAAA